MDELAGLPEDANFKLVVLVGDGMLWTSPHPTPSKALHLQPAYQANEADPKHMPEACFPGRRLKNVRS
jgi:hypothetical protein